MEAPSGCSTPDYRLSALRYDQSKLKVKVWWKNTPLPAPTASSAALLRIICRNTVNLPLLLSIYPDVRKARNP
jgi:hypothetical protein